METKTIDEYVQENGIFLNIILEPIRMTHAFPNTIDDVQDLFSNILFKPPRALSNRLFYACIENSYINLGRVITEKENIEISDFCKASISKENLVNRKSIQIENAIHLSAAWGGTNYWHWIVSSLSRLSLLKDIPQDSTYIINSLNNKFVVDPLQVMEINPKKCIEIDKVGCVYCRKLFLPSLMGDFDKMGLLFLRKKIKE